MNHKVIELDSVLTEVNKTNFINNGYLIWESAMYQGPIQYYLKLIAKKNGKKNFGDDPYTMVVSVKHKKLENIKNRLSKYFDVSKVGPRSRPNPIDVGFAFRFGVDTDQTKIKNIFLETIDQFINESIGKIFDEFEKDTSVEVVTGVGLGIIIRISRTKERVEVGQKQVSREEYKEFYHPGLNSKYEHFCGIVDEIDEKEGPDHKWTIPVYEDVDFYDFKLFCSNQML